MDSFFDFHVTWHVNERHSASFGPHRCSFAIDTLICCDRLRKSLRS